jgi:hypothetical protein
MGNRAAALERGLPQHGYMLQSKAWTRTSRAAERAGFRNRSARIEVGVADDR